MGIVERVANRLGRSEKPVEKVVSEDKRAGVAALPLDLAAANQGAMPQISEPKAVTAGTMGQNAPMTARNEPTLFKIDMDRLRQINMVVPGSERTPMAECFRRIKRPILMNARKNKAETASAANLVMVTSALPGEGKTFCAINLAISIAMEMDRTVLLVDADVAKPSILPTLGLDAGQPGLMDVLADETIQLADVLCKTDMEKLTILPAGTQHLNATEMLASEAMRALLREMADRYHDRIIIFDSPPLLIASEASVLASHMTQILIVSAAGETTEAALKEALSRVESCEFVGLLLNKTSASGSGYGYGYGYGYGSSA